MQARFGPDGFFVSLMRFLEIQLGMNRADVKIIGSKVLSLTVVDSTNSYLQREITSGLLEEGLVVNAQQQTKGKGQRGSQWFSLMGENILMSVLLYPAFLTPDKQFYLSMAMALGAAEFVQELLPQHTVNIKWPNDILVNGKKVGGILIENSTQGNILKNSIVGIGINVRWCPPDKTAWPAAALADFADMSDPQKLLPRLYELLDQKYAMLKDGHYDVLKSAYLHRLYAFGEEREFKDLVNQEYFLGTITGVDEFGRLLVEQERGIKEYALKEIAFAD
jgi:BirA family biotin operon repressor/biotin-[acetyl-CoA-carboxylase] ligase